MKSISKYVGVVLLVSVITFFSFKPEADKYFEISKNLEIFANLYKEINSLYVDEVDPGQLMRTGIDAMMESLDPYTNYISEADIEGYRYLTEGRYNGIGAVSKKVGDFVTITQLYKDQPADKAGLKVGDMIMEVDGKDAEGKSIDAVNDILRGFPGSSVVLKIKRPGEKDPLEISLVREEVEVPNVPFKGIVSDGIGYVALTTFTRNAGENVGNALKELKKENPELKGVILDLRNNGGGLLNEAVNVSNIFIPRNKLVVTTKGKIKDWDRSFSTLFEAVDEQIPLAVLINGRSASASEIVCGVMQDYDRGILIGQRSYGKGLVQNTRDIGYNAKVKVTTAKYYIPSGRCIQSVEYENGEPVDIADNKRTQFKTVGNRVVLDGGGVKPDIVVDKPTEGALITTLLRENYLFDYVTEFCQKNESIPSVEAFSFTDFDGFVAYLEGRNFSYQTKTEKALEKVTNEAKKEGYTLNASYLESMESEVEKAKSTELMENKDYIINLIEKEIASRYYYTNGLIRMGLKNDKEIEEAISVLNDQKRYDDILEGKQ